MQGIAKLCILGAALAFLVAVAQSLFLGNIMGIPPESYSRASTNLALLGIGIALVFKDGAKTAG